MRRCHPQQQQQQRQREPFKPFLYLCVLLFFLFTLLFPFHHHKQIFLLSHLEMEIFLLLFRQNS